MERILKIELPVFDYTITVVVTDDIIKSRNDRAKEIGGEIGLKNINIMALHACHNDKAESYLFFYEGASVNTITHECFHSIFRLTEWINAEIEQENFAFHIGYLAQKVFDFMNLKPKSQTIKNKKNEK